VVRAAGGPFGNYWGPALPCTRTAPLKEKNKKP
jgi:hypothetical protein